VVGGGGFPRTTYFNVFQPSGARVCGSHTLEDQSEPTATSMQTQDGWMDG